MRFLYYFLLFLSVYFIVTTNSKADSTLVERKIFYDKSNVLEFHYFKIPMRDKKIQKSEFIEAFHGPYKEFYSNGKLRMEGNYDLGKNVGTWKSYFPDGKLKSLETYDEVGSKNGLFEYYVNNGIKTCSGSYFNDQQVGVWTFQILDENTKKFNQTTKSYISVDEIKKTQLKNLYEQIKVDEKNIIYVPYPPEDIYKQIQGKAVFLVGSDSLCRISSFKVLNSLSPTIDSVCKKAIEKHLLAKKEKLSKCEKAKKEIDIKFSLN